jgi:hypothetical protein
MARHGGQAAARIARRAGLGPNYAQCSENLMTLPSDDFEGEAARNCHPHGMLGVLSATSASACIKTRDASSCSDLP